MRFLIMLMQLLIQLLLVLSDELGGRLARTSGQLAVMEHL